MKVIDEKIKLAREIIKTTNFKHAAIIMDGNRRWAKEKKLPTALGHKEGVVALKKTLKAADELGIKYITVYAFSTENWKRTPEEVTFLMDLLAHTLKNELDEMHKNNIVISFIGNIEELKPSLIKILENSVEKTKHNTGVHLQIAFNYGSRAEIVNACKKIAQETLQGNLNLDAITEETFSKALYTGDIPEPDILIRTGGEMRISNYLLWQIAYSELYILDCFWPDFGTKELCDVIIDFGNRNRRWGK